MGNKKPMPVHKDQKSSSFYKKIIIGIICIAILLGLVEIYSLIQSRSKHYITGNQITSSSIVIADGSIYANIQGKKDLIIDKTLVKNGKWPTDIVEIISMAISPDKTKLVFRTYEGSHSNLLYYSDIEGRNIIYIDPAAEVVWSPTGRYIAYTKSASEVGPLNVFVYDTATHQQKIVAKESRNICNTGYSIYTNISWLPDESGINTHYEQHACPPPIGHKIKEGETTLHFAQ